MLIVGGGYAGLASSVFLSAHGVPSVLADRHPAVSVQGRARGINQRTMELYRPLGLEPALLEATRPFAADSGVARCQTLSGEWELLFDPAPDPAAALASPSAFCMADQNTIEPLLRAAAEDKGADLRLNTKVADVSIEADGVTAVLADSATGRRRSPGPAATWPGSARRPGRLSPGRSAGCCAHPDGARLGDVAEITLVKGDTSALDRTWMSMPDGSTRLVAVHVVHDLPHLVVESLFGIEDGLWGVLAQGGFSAANRARTRSRGRRARLVTDVQLDGLGARNWSGHIVAKAVTNAVVNRWQDGPDTPDGVRTHLRPDSAADADYRQRIGDLLGRLDDSTIALAISSTRELSTAWARLPAGGMLRLEWPLPARPSAPDARPVDSLWE